MKFLYNATIVDPSLNELVYKRFKNNNFITVFIQDPSIFDKILGMFDKSESITSDKEYLPRSEDIPHIDEEVYEYGSKGNIGSSKIEILFMTTLQRKTKIIIDPNKSMNDLIKFYLEKVEKPELFGDPSIGFIKNAVAISHDSKDLIKKYIKKNDNPPIILVDDLEDKIGYAFHD